MGTPVANTRQTMGKYEIVKIRIPSDKQQGASPVEDITCTYRMATDENAAFVVGKSWYQSVGSCYFLDVVGDATIHYGGTEVLRVDRLSTQYFNGGLKQIVTNDGEQAVTSNWTQKVAARCHGHYGQWDVDVDTSWTVTVADDITIKSAAGMVTISSPTKIALVAPAVEISGAQVTRKASGWDKGHSGESFETYNSKVIIGGHKSDYVAALYTCGYGVKVETTGYSAGLFGVKGETAGVKKKSFGAVFAQLGCDAATAYLHTGGFGLNAVSAGLHAFK